jgi:DNA-binding NarL/FixJ family response regulator
MADVSAPIRVAICDDHPIFRAGLRDLLRSATDFELVFEAGTLAELLAMPPEVRVDVLLVDVGLPDGSGLDAVGPFANRARVLVLSAHDEPATLRRAFEQGAIGFLLKDAPAPEVIASVRRAASGNTVLTASHALSVARALRDDTDRGRFLRAVESLSARQREVLALLAEGKSNREIGGSLFVSEGTVKNHVSQILRVLDVPDRTRLALLVSRYGLDT